MYVGKTMMHRSESLVKGWNKSGSEIVERIDFTGFRLSVVNDFTRQTPKCDHKPMCEVRLL